MLCVACYHGHRGVAELLIRRGIEVNTKHLVNYVNNTLHYFIWSTVQKRSNSPAFCLP